MFLKANGPGAEKVMKPVKYANILRPIPLALMVVGKISAHHTNEGASMNWKRTINKKIKATAAASPALFSVPRYCR